LQPWAGAAAQEKQKADKSAAPLDTPQSINKPQPPQPAQSAKPADRRDLEAVQEEAAEAIAEEQSRAEELRADLADKRQELKDQISELAELQARSATERISNAEVRRLQREIGKLQAEIMAMAQSAASEATWQVISCELQKEFAKVREKIDVRIAARLDNEIRKAQQRALSQSAGQGEATALTADNIVQLKMYGVTPEYIESLRKPGYDNLQMKMHGVTEEFIKDARRRMQKHFSESVDQAENARD
jgi:hypothetical protein